MSAASVAPMADRTPETLESKRTHIRGVMFDEIEKFLRGEVDGKHLKARSRALRKPPAPKSACKAEAA